MFMRLAHVSRLAGDKEGAQAAVESVKQDLANLYAAGLEFSWVYRAEAMLAAYENNSDRTIEALALVLRHGYRDPVFFRDPIFDTFGMIHVLSPCNRNWTKCWQWSAKRLCK
jgi:hypothetical protein